MKEYIKRALLCTSPLQVINARASMDYNQEKGERYNDSLIIIHPEIGQRSKALISEIGKQLDYDKIYDLTKQIEKIVKLLRSNALRDFMPFIHRNVIKEKNKGIVNIVGRIRERLYSDNQLYDEIYCRGMQQIESFVIKTCIPSTKIFFIEDGIGGYRRKYDWKINKRELKFGLKRLVVYFLKLLQGYDHDFIHFYLPKKDNNQKVFSNLEHGSNIVVANYFIQEVTKLSRTEKCDPTKKIVIIGSLLGGFKKMKITLPQEVDLYNRIIGKISKIDKVSNSEIWYKPHPRCTYEVWKYKKENLRCEIYDFDDNPLFEVELASPHLKAVYSVGSTSLLYAKAIFGLDAFLIDVRKYNIHPTAFDMYYDVCTRYGVEIIQDEFCS